MDRRLAAIAFADIVGYSILMARDETRTHQRWMAILNDVLHPQAALHRGKIVKSTGDGVLAEFPSAFDAVQWAADVQRAVQVQALVMGYHRSCCVSQCMSATSLRPISTCSAMA